MKECVRCGGEEDSEWSDCLECSVDPVTSAPIDCEVCGGDFDLILSSPTDPKHRCTYPNLVNCADQVGKDCRRCDEGFWKDPEENNSCQPCGINKCKSCVAVTNDIFIDGDVERITYPSCMECDDDSQYLYQTWLNGDKQTPVTKCGWVVNPIENCRPDGVNPDDPSVCDSCVSERYFDRSLKACRRCDAEIDGCKNCDSSWQCSECHDGMSLNSDSQCWESHCSIQNAIDIDTCDVCEEGWYVNPIDGLCVSECPEGFLQNNYTDICVKDCTDGWHAYNDWTSPNKCHPCNEGDHGVDHCMECVSHDFGMSNICLMCGGGLMPDAQGLRCQVPNCREHLADDKCLECEHGYFLTHDTGLCVNRCAGHYRAVPELQLCAEKCMTHQFVGDDHLCHDCGDMEEGCRSCNYYAGEEHPFECVDCLIGQTLSHDGKCTGCQEHEFELNDGTCKACHESMHGCGKCSFDGLADW